VRVGKGMFGLTEWYPNRPKRKRTNGDQTEAETENLSAEGTEADELT